VKCVGLADEETRFRKKPSSANAGLQAGRLVKLEYQQLNSGTCAPSIAGGVATPNQSIQKNLIFIF
jgi:hypothetical protein